MFAQKFDFANKRVTKSNLYTKIVPKRLFYFIIIMFYRKRLLNCFVDQNCTFCDTIGTQYSERLCCMYRSMDAIFCIAVPLPGVHYITCQVPTSLLLFFIIHAIPYHLAISVLAVQLYLCFCVGSAVVSLLLCWQCSCISASVLDILICCNIKLFFVCTGEAHEY